jgi:hypothetical protein
MYCIVYVLCTRVLVEPFRGENTIIIPPETQRAPKTTDTQKNQSMHVGGYQSGTCRVIFDTINDVDLLLL